ncbi:hypothetical protein CLM85_16205 [Streptomyces albidoflavus]|uniref:hypothetical protein n=1 Tax=Streptomyces albidoflavus TaxID=1886 RepID=UPI000BADE30F|nr:hypothetical protein [Streptomyces albidoflavus]PAX87012.1 hypothetical protein CLM81_07570 [Streptomyces albidoflavus]PAX90472.1 hypothetical protein CLM82_15125 [Streptomyces albidoflavus]PBO16170.1 hypothetical protein CLM83_25470 [Streptomyces albidoflavus]PBO23423.1 hypothetical protein CLM85_16205 [Streptomyces albidoflavus]PBO26634.1 hypothetical protein CLM84_30625 [Streptomyces albidoflavus]
MSAQHPEGRFERRPEPQFTPCGPCHHLTLAEAEANAAYDWSKATDFRVLLKRHRATGECSAPGPV